MKGERILVAGCGDVGSALARRLVADGATVFGLRRRPEHLPSDVVPIAIDLRRSEEMKRLPAGVTCLVFAAAADGSDEGSYRAIYVEGLRNLLSGLAASGSAPSRLVFTSSTAVYGQTGGEWVDETSSTEPPGFSGRVMLEAEALLAEHASPLGATAASIRLGGIYGPGRTRLVDLVRSGRATCAEGSCRWTNRIHVEDAADAVRHILRIGAAGGTWVGVDDEPADQCAVYDWLAERMGLPRPPRVPESAEARRGAEASNKRCSNRRLRASGFRFRFPSFREGYARMLEGGR
ncbi:SDR family oxidoreductase [bacterium]|nr:SDR family oxidoreductase [bacterium]